MPKERPTATAGELQDSKYTLHTNSQDVRNVLDVIYSRPHAYHMSKRVTGAIIAIDETSGDFSEVWLCQNCAPYHVNAPYTRVK